RSAEVLWRGPQDFARPVDTNPMIRELETRLQRHVRHVAINAMIRDTHRHLWVRLCSVTAGTPRVVIGVLIFQQRLVRIVTRYAGKPALTLLKTRTLAKIQRLMTNVPSVIPLRRSAARRRLPMARATE